MPPNDRPLHAVLFDVDGTLVDSNYLHIEAWGRAFRSLGVQVDAWRIHRRLGMDSARMLGELLGDEAPRLADAARTAHRENYRAAADRLEAFDGARALLAELADHGVTTALATSAPADELELLRRVLGSAAADVITTNADDVETAKPHPGIVEVALHRAGVPAGDAVFVGDSTWDMIAARAAGVAAIGVLSGGIGEDELRAAGADRVVAGVAELLGMSGVPASDDEDGMLPGE